MLTSQSSSGNDSCSKSGGGYNNIYGCKNNSSISVCITVVAAIITVIVSRVEAEIVVIRDKEKKMSLFI